MMVEMSQILSPPPLPPRPSSSLFSIFSWKPCQILSLETIYISIKMCLAFSIRVNTFKGFQISMLTSFSTKEFMWYCHITYAYSWKCILLQGVFSLKCCHFSLLCQFCCSAGVLSTCHLVVQA